MSLRLIGLGLASAVLLAACASEDATSGKAEVDKMRAEIEANAARVERDRAARAAKKPALNLEETVFESVEPFDPESARAAADGFFSWCVAFFKATPAAPTWRRAAFLNRAEGFGLWAVATTNAVSGSREDGVCAGFVTATTMSFLLRGEAELVGAARAAFGVTATGRRTRTKGGWPSLLVIGPSKSLGRPVIMRFMRKKPGADAEDGAVKVTIGLFEAEA